MVTCDAVGDGLAFDFLVEEDHDLGLAELVENVSDGLDEGGLHFLAGF